MTRDHSFVEALVSKSAITREEAFKHPKRNVITQSVGISPDTGLQVDTVSGVLARGEKLLLCSDRLNDELSDSSIAEVLSRYISPVEQVHQLIQGALKSGGRDNITVIIIDPDQAQVEHDTANAQLPRKLQQEAAEENPDLDRHTILMDKTGERAPAKTGFKKSIGKLFTLTKKLFK